MFFQFIEMGEDQNSYKDLALRFQGIIETAIDGIITIDSAGIIESVNASASKLFEYDESELIGENVSKLMQEPHHSNHDGYIKRYQTTKKPRIIGIGREVMGRKKSGSIFPFRLAVSEVILNDKVIFTGIIHDLTEVNTAKENLRQLNQELEQRVEERTAQLSSVVQKLEGTNSKLKSKEEELIVAINKEKDLNELKSRFVSMASHEFRTPLSAIKSSASLITKYERSEEQGNRESHVEKINSAVNNLTGILNDFLSLGKIEEGHVVVKKSKVDIKSLMNKVYDELKFLLIDQELNFEIKGQFKYIYTDVFIFKNLLFNLVSNAIKYSNETGQIYCELVQDNNDLKLMVQDNGIGIPVNEQKYLFQRFFRASNAEHYEGTGLGLHIAKRYVNMLNGTIEFMSEEDKGTKFFINLPNAIYNV